MITIAPMHWGPNCKQCDGFGEVYADMTGERVEQCDVCDGLTVQMWCDWCRTEDCGTGEYRDWYRVEVDDEYHHCASWECVAECLERVLREAGFMEKSNGQVDECSAPLGVRGDSDRGLGVAVRLEFTGLTLYQDVIDDDGRVAGYLSHDVGTYEARVRAISYRKTGDLYTTIGAFEGPDSIERAAEAVIRDHRARLGKERRERLAADTLPPQPLEGARVEWAQDGGA